MIRPTAFNPDGSVDVWHDEANHGGTAVATHVRFGANPDGGPNPRALVIACPVAGCNSETLHHPVGDGIARPEIQRLYVRMLTAKAAALGIPLNQRSLAAIKARLKQYVQDQDGDLGRWTLEDLAQA